MHTSLRARSAGRRAALASLAVLLLLVAMAVQASPASAASCGGSASAPPGGAWGPESQASVAFSGSPGFTKWYSWNVVGNFATPVAVQVRGFNGSGQATWYDLPISYQGSSGSVPWGSVLAYPRLRARTGGTGALLMWSC